MNDEITYTTDVHGVIHQMPCKTTVFPNYADKYNSLPLQVRAMSFLRLGMITKILDKCKYPISILDIGPGNRDFLKTCGASGLFQFIYDYDRGDDINDYTLEHQWEIVTLFDSLEHLEDLSLLSQIRTRFYVISVPCCWWNQDDPRFLSWKHRRPGEHLHHFSPDSLKAYMFSIGFKQLFSYHIEDAIRVNDEQPDPNILTAIFMNQQIPAFILK